MSKNRTIHHRTHFFKLHCCSTSLTLNLDEYCRSEPCPTYPYIQDRLQTTRLFRYFLLLVAITHPGAEKRKKKGNVYTVAATSDQAPPNHNVDREVSVVISSSQALTTMRRVTTQTSPRPSKAKAKRSLPTQQQAEKGAQESPAVLLCGRSCDKSYPLQSLLSGQINDRHDPSTGPGRASYPDGQPAST